MCKKRIVIRLFLALLLLFNTALPIFAVSASDFTDVASGDWYYEAVEYAVSNGLTTGTSGTTFGPGASMTRAQFVAILGRVEKVDTANVALTGKFLDVSNGQYYAPYVYWASEHGIVSGTSDTVFAPNSDISREQMAAIIARYLAFKDANLPDTESAVSAFTDAEKISDWAEGSVEALRKCGLLSGDDRKNVNPQNTMTRAEGVTVFMRLCNGLADLGLYGGGMPIDVTIPGQENPEPPGAPETSSEPEAPVDPVIPATSAYTNEVIRLVNIEREKAGVYALSTLDALQSAAQLRAEELVSVFSHDRPDGSSCFTALDEFNVTYRAAGENIAAGQRTPQEVVTSWMNSPGHRRNILSDSFTHIGVGYCTAESGEYGSYWSQLFIGE